MASGPQRGGGESVRPSLDARCFLRLVIAILVATILLFVLLLAVSPDLLIVLAWQHADRLPHPSSWGPPQVHEAILLVGIAAWLVVVVLVAWFLAKRL